MTRSKLFVDALFHSKCFYNIFETRSHTVFSTYDTINSKFIIFFHKLSKIWVKSNSIAMTV